MLFNIIDPPRTSPFETEGNPKAVGDLGDSGAHEEISVPHFCISWDRAEVQTKAALKSELLRFQGSKDQCGHPSASEGSRRASEYPEDKRPSRSAVSEQTIHTRSSAWALPKILLPEE
ncbi:hypothetical protein RF11_15361 [Thelohanellus kitauei]|uniref:Uncharacterized protein n=1 Tax=Thelohanellus kitauei TaxID=669202 RepID=A0A0C2I5A4_THEKT|nr:hypothetical protein RF11_15361 [Thelohanellus kitauei]